LAFANAFFIAVEIAFLALGEPLPEVVVGAIRRLPPGMRGARIQTRVQKKTGQELRCAERCPLLELPEAPWSNSGLLA
jgi:hypothetical protein